jgi:hypothetical protein
MPPVIHVVSVAEERPFRRVAGRLAFTLALDVGRRRRTRKLTLQTRLTVASALTRSRTFTLARCLRGTTAACATLSLARGFARAFALGLAIRAGVVTSALGLARAGTITFARRIAGRAAVEIGVGLALTLAGARARGLAVGQCSNTFAGATSV